ncbi:VacJ family lipoprotein [Novosphingobium sp. G106]|uniref:MlaA family lipoprotein n=1 Tax=Novosphingobium sp. G106 TaxID=2849500 RepID=UPI001C2D08B9|nr:VacJ family lipoprotein [Novosphingobium sp. G106]MBV1688644.1 VacJ family lipoprotein [Novosphingobium sp. G106]
MLGAHLIAASLAAATPAVAVPAQAPQPPASSAPAVLAHEPEPEVEVLPDPAASPVEMQEAPPVPAEAPVAASPGSVDDFDLDLDQAGLAHDPLEGFNRVSYDFSQFVDKILIRPAAMVYRHAVPKPARDGVHNALSNIGEPLVFVNDLLQLRPDRAIRTLGRFLVNSTLGIGGLFDVAKRKPFRLAHHENSFGDTLGYYGVKPGPYVYVPILGPNTFRDLIGSSENLLPPMVVGKPFDREDYQIVTLGLDGVDQRERSDDDLKVMLRDAIDPYATFRANYLQNRAGEIAALKSRSIEPGGEAGTEPGAKPAPDDPLADPMVDPAAPVQAPAPSGP